MNPTEREPFSTGEVPFSTVEPESHSAPAVNGTAHTVLTSKHTVRYKLPSSAVYRIKRIIEAERRTTSTVMEKVIEDFLSVPVNNPVPYLQYNLYTEDWIVFSWTMPDALKERLQARAMSEGRLNDGRCASNIIVARALMDYIEASPDDPMKNLPPVQPEPAPVEEEDPSEEISDDSESESAEPIPEDEGVDEFEEAVE